MDNLFKLSIALTFCRTSVLSLTGCSPAEPASVYTDAAKIQLHSQILFSTTKKHPKKCPLEGIEFFLS